MQHTADKGALCKYLGWPCSTISQCTDGVSFDLFADLLQHVNFIWAGIAFHCKSPHIRQREATGKGTRDDLAALSELQRWGNEYCSPCPPPPPSFWKAKAACQIKLFCITVCPLMYVKYVDRCSWRYFRKKPTPWALLSVHFDASGWLIAQLWLADLSGSHTHQISARSCSSRTRLPCMVCTAHSSRVCRTPSAWLCSLQCLPTCSWQSAPRCPVPSVLLLGHQSPSSHYRRHWNAQQNIHWDDQQPKSLESPYRQRSRVPQHHVIL